VAITTDIITGFPGESEAEFSTSAAFIEETGFADGHVFTYSARPGTAAALLPGQVPPATSKKRSARMRSILQESSTLYRESYLGQELHVLWERTIPEGENQWLLSGLTDNYLRVSTTSTTPYHNQITKVHLTRINNGELLGEISPTYT
jgi:threonylcarbamoyladenosine tRNA methylthiotransferase MtaB